MLEAQSILRRTAFFFYVALVPSIPLSILWGRPGLAMGLLLGLFWLVQMRLATANRIQKTLALAPALETQFPVLYTLLREHCRRARIPIPSVKLMPNRSLNMGAYGFGAHRTTIFLTNALVETFSREELSASLAWLVTKLGHRHIPCDTWLSGFLFAVERKSGPRFSQVLRQALILPLGFFPNQLLLSHKVLERLDPKASRLSKLPWEQAEAFKKIRMSVQKDPPRISLGLSHLFAIFPPPKDPLSRVLFPNLKLTQNPV